MMEFSPLNALAGGALIGTGAVVLMLANRRVLGISGILGGVVGEPASKETPWRLAFIAGMMLPALALSMVGDFSLRGSGLGLGLLVLAGFLVGLGTRMGNGCTSGHGICGLARLSKRSLAAVLTFMAVAGLLVFIRRHVVGG